MSIGSPSSVAVSLAVLVGLAGLTGWTMTRSDALIEAEAAYGRSDLTTALRRALDHLDRRPWSSEARRIAGLCLVRLDRPDLVPGYLDLARHFDRDDAIHRAQGLERVGRIGPAAEVYEMILGRIPDDSVAIERLAILRAAEGRFEECIGLTDRLRDNVSLAARAAAIRTGALLRLGKPDEAASGFELTLGLDPSLKSIVVPLSAFWRDGIAAMLQSGRGAAARRLLEGRLAARGEDAVLLDRLGTIAQEEGRADDAEALWRRANVADPTLAGPWLALGRIALGRDRVIEAIALLKRAAALDPGDPGAPEVLGRAFQLTGRAEESSRQRRRAESLRARTSGRLRDPGSGTGLDRLRP